MAAMKHVLFFFTLPPDEKDLKNLKYNYIILLLLEVNNKSRFFVIIYLQAVDNLLCNMAEGKEG
jgi:hypothetical protein